MNLISFHCLGKLNQLVAIHIAIHIVPTCISMKEVILLAIRAVTGHQNNRKPRNNMFGLDFPDFGLVRICVIESIFYEKWRRN